MRQFLVVPAIGSREIACAQRSLVRRGKHALQRLDIGDHPLDVHGSSITNAKPGETTIDGVPQMGVAFSSKKTAMKISAVTL